MIPGHHAMDGTGQVDVAALVGFAQRAEELGFDFLVAQDHLFVPSYWSEVIPDRTLDPFALLTYLGASTERIGLHVGCLVVPHRTPLDVAKQVASIDQLTGGRFILGVVPGYLREEFDATGVRHELRGVITEEHVTIIRELWSSDRATFDGERHRFRDVHLKPRCAQSPHVPIWFGGSSRRSIRRAVELGEGWTPLAFDVIPDSYRRQHSVELAGKALPTSGTTPERLRDDLSYAAEVADAQGRSLDIDVIVYPGPPQREGAATGVPLANRTKADSEELVDWVGRFIESGATGYVAPLGAPDMAEHLEAMEAFATSVLPTLGSRAAHGAAGAAG